ncbi:MAG: metal-dependent hydrolase [Myxococcales bacterium]|nr:metal-dependent hydrolase [Myxococcales bacterium]
MVGLAAQVQEVWRGRGNRRREAPAITPLEVAPGERPIVVRRMGFPFKQGFPRWWFGESAFLTHLLNGLNFVFPAGERFFIRSVREFEGQLHDEELRARVRAFFGQESQHQVEHLHAFEALEKQGFEIKSFLVWYQNLAYKRLEPRLSPLMRLSITAALEHFTAIFGDFVLSSDFLDTAHPMMRELLLWHAAEEIEHKSVTFDVLQAVDPRYHVRLAGFLVATVGLFFFWSAGTLHLLRQEDANTRKGSRAEYLNFFFREAPRIVFDGLDYLRLNFHPDDEDNYELARSYLEKIGRLAA